MIKLRILSFVLIMLSIFTIGSVRAQEGTILDAKTISIKDMESHIKSMYIPPRKKNAAAYCTLVKIYGIYQDDNQAIIYFVRKWIQLDRRGKKGEEHKAVKLVRLNSGRWFNPDIFDYVAK